MRRDDKTERGKSSRRPSLQRSPNDSREAERRLASGETVQASDVRLWKAHAQADTVAEKSIVADTEPSP